MQKWNVYLYGKLIETVFFCKEMSCSSVKLALINHDGFNCQIQIVKGK